MAGRDTMASHQDIGRVTLPAVVAQSECGRVTRLQAAGLIDRHRRAGDRRTVEATLTDAGRSRFVAAERTAQALMRRHLGPGLDAQGLSGRSCDVT